MATARGLRAANQMTRLCERCGEREALHTPTIITRDGQMVSEQYLCTICQYLVMRAARAGNMDVRFPDEQPPIEPEARPAHEPEAGP